jgi:hypothetical protein
VIAAVIPIEEAGGIPIGPTSTSQAGVVLTADKVKDAAVGVEVGPGTADAIPGIDPGTPEIPGIETIGVGVATQIPGS